MAVSYQLPRLMYVAKGRIVKSLKNVSIYKVYVSYRLNLRVHPLHLLRIFAKGKIVLMANQYISFIFIYIFPLNNPMKSLIVGEIILIFIETEYIFYKRRAHKREKIKVYLPIFIFKYHFFNVFICLLRRKPDKMQVVA